MISAPRHPPGLPYRLDLTFRRNTTTTYYRTDDEATDAGIDAFHANDACRAWRVWVSVDGKWKDVQGEENLGDGVTWGYVGPRPIAPQLR